MGFRLKRFFFFLSYTHLPLDDNISYAIGKISVRFQLTSLEPSLVMGRVWAQSERGTFLVASLSLHQFSAHWIVSYRPSTDLLWLNGYLPPCQEEIDCNSKTTAPISNLIEESCSPSKVTPRNMLPRPVAPSLQLLLLAPMTWLMAPHTS